MITKCNEIGILTGGKWDKMYDQSRRVYGADGLCPTLHTCGGGNQEIKIAVNGGDHINTIVELINLNAKHQQDLIQHKDGICRCIPAGTHGSTPHLTKTVVSDNPLRIRKLTPLECWRLMGFTDEDFHKAEKECSDTQLYKQAGNSIGVPVLEGILRNLIPPEEFVPQKQTPLDWLNEFFGGD